MSPVPEAAQKRYGVRAAYFYVDVTTDRLHKISEGFDSGRLVAHVGNVLPLKESRRVVPEKKGAIDITAISSFVVSGAHPTKRDLPEFETPAYIQHQSRMR